MAPLTPQQSQEISVLVTALLEDRLSYKEFLTKLPGKDNEDVKALLNLIEHQPSARGFFGKDQSTLAKEYEVYIRMTVKQIVKKYGSASESKNETV